MAWHLGVKVCGLRLEGCMSHGNWVFWQKHMPTFLVVGVTTNSGGAETEHVGRSG